jgi:hypothetical protein
LARRCSAWPTWCSSTTRFRRCGAETGAALISPATGFNRLAFGDRFKPVFASHDPVYYSRLQLGFSGTAQNESGTSTTKLNRNEALVDYAIDYGLPASRATRTTVLSTTSRSRPRRRAPTVSRMR